MRGIRFWVIGVVSFIIVTVGTIFVPGSFLNRAFSVASCAIFSFNSAFCAPNLGIDSERAIAVNTSQSATISQQESTNIIENNHLLAFDSFNTDEEGHRGITLKATSGTWVSPVTKMPLIDKNGENIRFTDKAKEEIERANRKTDLKENFLDKPGPFSIGTESLFSAESPFSEYFDQPDFHFDSETFSQASDQLIKKREQIIAKLSSIEDSSKDDAIAKGVEARKLLGQALHTLQDFYAHTNWVELGFNENQIDDDLGRRRICYNKDANGYVAQEAPCPNSDRPQCPKKSYVYLLDGQNNTCMTAQSLTSSDIMGVIETDYRPQQYSSEYRERKLEEILKNPALYDSYILRAWESDPAGKKGKLRDEFKGNRNKTKLTSGYYMGNTSPCSAPPGKTRHGFLTCHGLNKDEPTTAGYAVASSQAVKASKDYINQIIQGIFDNLNASNKIESIKALMGLIDEPPCNSENNKKKSGNKQNPQQCPMKSGGSIGDPHLATFDGLKYDLQALGEFILTKSNNGAFEVQARHAPFSSSFSINSAVAIKVGNDRVALYAREFPDADTSTPLRVNGKPTKIQGNKLTLPGGGEILQQGGNYVINSPTGEKVLVNPSGAGSNAYLDISPFVYNRSGKYSGLLGNINGNPNDIFNNRLKNWGAIVTSLFIPVC